IVGSCSTPGDAYEVSLSGNFAYVADQYAGFQIADISNPLSPTIVEGVETSDDGDASGVFASGAYAYVADYRGGLQVIYLGKYK
ncbi:MAG: hypothetical protein GY754_14325, partial [bacterium]|nr:hypothetical protein [bacterium]